MLNDLEVAPHLSLSSWRRGYSKVADLYVRVKTRRDTDHFQSWTVYRKGSDVRIANAGIETTTVTVTLTLERIRQLLQGKKNWLCLSVGSTEYVHLFREDALKLHSLLSQPS